MVNKEQSFIIQNLIDKCIFPCVFDIKLKERYIRVPQDMLENYTDCMFAKSLNVDYGFSIQSVMPGSVVVKNKFNPEERNKERR